MKKFGIIMIGICAWIAMQAQTGNFSYARAMANTAIATWPDSFSAKPGQPAKWTYDQGVILKGIEGLWNASGEGRWFSYIQKSMDFFVQDAGSIRGYKPGDNHLRHLYHGR